MVELTDAKTEILTDLVNSCVYMKNVKDAADIAYKTVKVELEELCKEYGITSFHTEDADMKITESRRFKGYGDDKVVLGMIPLQHRGECTSLDRKKIDGLIKKGVLSNAIKDEEKYTRITTTKFTAVK